MELFLLVDIINRVNALSEGVVEIGSVETVGSIGDAWATLTGEFPLQQLNLGLPRGVQGIAGLDGLDGLDGAAATSSHVALDTDGVPYFDLVIPVETSRALQADTDGVPYFV